MIKIIKNNIFKDPPHIFVNTAFDQKKYDAIYENWHNTNHVTWKKFLDEYKLTLLAKFDNKKTFEYDGDQPIIGIILCKDRTDRRYIKIDIGTAFREYRPNALLIIKKDQQINFSDTESPLPDKPFLVVGFDKLFLETVNKFF